nr:unnamed protein product [Digitaria exilis]
MTLDTPATVVLELMTMGQQSAAHLGDLLRAASPAPSPHQELASEILRCCGRVIDALRHAAASTGRKRRAAEYLDFAPPAAAAPEAWSPPPPPPPPAKRRARGSEAVKEVTSGTTVDGYIWRKYGQKDINGYEHPRLYYRCAHKQQQGCNATRRVQRTREHPAAYEIAYYGEHTCNGASAADACRLEGGVSPPAVVDFGSTSWGSAADATTSRGGGSPAASVMSQGGSSPSSVSPSPSSEETGFEAHAHEWLDDAAALDDMLMGAAPCFVSDPVTEFLDGCRGWESVLDDPLDFAGLHHQIALFQ